LGETAYDDIIYPSAGQARLHIENLHLCALLNGYRPAPVERARVLELGCGTGFNLIPMAMELPEATFVGLDYAAKAIAIGREVAAQLSVSNIQLEEADISDPSLDFGQFDYIIAHGFYSWVPESVREAMWKLVSRSLAPQGIFHVSFNALPGWYTTYPIRDFIRMLGAGEPDIKRRIDKVWTGLQVLARHEDSGHLLAKEAARILTMSREVLFHDEMAEETTPFYLRDVVNRAQQAGLRYVAEADLQTPQGLHDHNDVRMLLATIPAVDQSDLRAIHDFMTMRRFHDTLLTQATHEPKPTSLSGTLQKVWAYSDIRWVEQTATGEQEFEHSGGRRIITGHPIICAIAKAFESAAPAAISLGELLVQFEKDNPGAGLELLQHFWPIVLQLLQGGVLRLRLRPVPVATSISERPMAGEFARTHAQWDDYVTNLYHAASTVPEPWQRLTLHLLDGTRDRETIVRDLAALCWTEIQTGRIPGHPQYARPYDIKQSPSLRQDPTRMESEEALRAYFMSRIDEVLRAFLRAGYLQSN
jgi:SAM-dependent methyltransferase/methyltransferase-like protein